MSNLMNEYRGRHRLKAIDVINEGVIFFESKKIKVICTTSTHSKALNSCHRCCPGTDKLVVEIYTPTNLSGVSPRLEFHDHISPGVDILEYTHEKLKDDQYKPFIPKTDRDQERWLWEFFLQNSKVLQNKSTEFKAFQATLSKNDGYNFVSEMVWCAEQMPAVMEIYYKRFYSVFLINRAYMLC